MASKWEKQLLGGLGLLGLASVIYLLGSQLPDEYTSVALLSIPVGIVGLIFMYFAIKVKQKSLRF